MQTKEKAEAAADAHEVCVDESHPLADIARTARVHFIEGYEAGYNAAANEGAEMLQKVKARIEGAITYLNAVGHSGCADSLRIAVNELQQALTGTKK